MGFVISNIKYSLEAFTPAQPLRMTAPCLAEMYPESSLPAHLYYLQDALYNVRALVSGASSKIEEQMAYDVYGRPTAWHLGDINADGIVDGADSALFSASWLENSCDEDYNWRSDFDYDGTVGPYDLANKSVYLGLTIAAGQISLFTNPYCFTGRTLDVLDGGGLLLQYNRNRYHDPDTGRWLTHDPLGITPNGKLNRIIFTPIKQYIDGLSLYEAVGSNPINNIDPYGLLSAEEFWDDWSEEERNEWFGDFKRKYDEYIHGAAKDNCIPYELLASIIANEQIDYSWFEAFCEEIFATMSSYGVAQISPETVQKYKLFGETFDYLSRDPTINKLLDPKTNIETAAKLIKIYLDEMCGQAKSKKGNRSQLLT